MHHLTFLADILLNIIHFLEQSLSALLGDWELNTITKKKIDKK
jgi:hypothetical protein